MKTNTDLIKRQKYLRYEDTQQMHEAIGSKFIWYIIMLLLLDALNIKCDPYIIAWNLLLFIIYFISSIFSYNYHYEQCLIINMMWYIVHIYVATIFVNPDGFDYESMIDYINIIMYGSLILNCVIFALDILCSTTGLVMWIFGYSIAELLNIPPG